MLTLLFKYFKRWNEFLLIPLALVIWKIHIWLLPLYDPTAAPPDAGIFSYGVALLVIVLMAKGFNWLLLKFTWPGLYYYLDQQLEKDLWDIPKLQRVYIASFFWAVSLLAIVLLFKTGF